MWDCYNTLLYTSDLWSCVGHLRGCVVWVKLNVCWGTRSVCCYSATTLVWIQSHLSRVTQSITVLSSKPSVTIAGNWAIFAKCAGANQGDQKKEKAHGNPRPQSVSILMQAGPTCRQSLQSHKRKDLLKKFIVPVEITTQLVQIPIANIKSKVVLICTSTGKYVVQQPNCLEHN